jgi:Bacteriophage lambda head decoration protein D
MANLDGFFSPQIFRKDYPQIIATNVHLATFLGVRLAYNANGYLVGQCLALNSSTGLFQNYVSSGPNGTGTAVGFLAYAVDVSEFQSTTGTVVQAAVFTGELNNSVLTGNDATADTQLQARRFQGSLGVSIYKF